MTSETSESELGDVERLRKPSELPHHWALRREFLLTHKDKFDQDRLVCLSNVFVNVESMGLTYPDEVMQKIKELGSVVDKSVVNMGFQEEEQNPVLNRYVPPPERDVYRHDQRRGGQHQGRNQDAQQGQYRRNQPPNRGFYQQQNQRYNDPFPARTHQVDHNHFGPTAQRGSDQQDQRYGRPFPARNQRDDNSRRYRR